MTTDNAALRQPDHTCSTCMEDAVVLRLERDRLREALERLEQAIADGYYLLSDAAVKELSRSPQRTPVALARAALAQSEEPDPLRSVTQGGIGGRSGEIGLPAQSEKARP